MQHGRLLLTVRPPFSQAQVIIHTYAYVHQILSDCARTQTWEPTTILNHLVNRPKGGPHVGDTCMQQANASYTQSYVGYA